LESGTFSINPKKVTLPNSAILRWISIFFAESLQIFLASMKARGIRRAPETI
jgi:hypothetical protein